MKHNFNKAASSIAEDLRKTGGRNLARTVYFTFMAVFLLGMLIHQPA